MERRTLLHRFDSPPRRFPLRGKVRLFGGPVDDAARRTRKVVAQMLEAARSRREREWRPAEEG